MFAAPLASTAALFILALSALAQTPGQQVRAIGEQDRQAQLDLFPMFEAFSQGAGPRQALAVLDIGPGYVEKERARQQRILEQLAAIAEDKLSETDRDSHAILRHRARSELERNAHPLLAIQLLMPGRGVHSSLIGLASGAQPLRTESDFEAWLLRVERSSAVYDQIIEILGEVRKQGWTQSKVLVERSLAQMEAVAARPGDQGPLWGPARRYPKAAGDDKRLAWEKRYREVLDARHLPALKRLIAFVREDYLPTARASAGIGSLPGGDKAYAAAVRASTTLDLTPEEVHAIGLAEVARLQPRLLATARSLGFQGELKDYEPWIRSNAAVHPFKSPDDVLAYLRAIHERVVPLLPKLFHRLPKAGFEIRLADAALAASASASYMGPAADGSRGGAFIMPVVDATKIQSYSLTALLLHEGMPGHHLDIALKQELDLPLFRKLGFLTAYTEGWGLYAESLGEELGIYSDPWALLGRYELELRRAARLVVDTGLHAKGWSREQAIRYLVEAGGQPERIALIEVERYMGDPGQALAYKTGEREILALRAKAKAALKERFDARDFHEVVLGAGPLPLLLLRQRVEAWISRQQAPAKGV